MSGLPARHSATQDRTILRNSTLALEEMLTALSKYGKPRVAHDGDGWYCAVDMYVSATGVDFKVKSDFSMRSPLDAARQCASRLDKALMDIGA